MIKSKTKYEASETEIRKLFDMHKVGMVENIEPLGNGEFNAAYKVRCSDGKNYALKIAPPEDAAVLTYEKNMMTSEVFWYEKMHKHTDILCPQIYVSDFSKEIIRSDCFIMQLMDGEPLWAVDFSPAEYENVQKQCPAEWSILISGTAMSYTATERSAGSIRSAASGEIRQQTLSRLVRARSHRCLPSKKNLKYTMRRRKKRSFFLRKRRYGMRLPYVIWT